MSNAPGIVVPDIEQSVAFHEVVMHRLGITGAGPVDRTALKRTLDRFYSMVQSGERDIFWVTAYLMFDFIRGKVFGKGSVQTGIALPFAFLYRNGIAVAPPDPMEVAGVASAIANGDAYVGVLEDWLRQNARAIR